MTQACNVITQQLHWNYKSRGLKLHALISASIKPKPNSPAVEGQQERSKHGRTVLIISSWESRLAELLKYSDIKNVQPTPIYTFFENTSNIQTGVFFLT